MMQAKQTAADKATGSVDEETEGHEDGLSLTASARVRDASASVTEDELLAR